MKPNPKFDSLTLRWWKLTTIDVKAYAQGALMWANSRGPYLDYSKTCRNQLRQLCRTRREVFRAGTVLDN